MKNAKIVELDENLRILNQTHTDDLGYFTLKVTGEHTSLRVTADGKLTATSATIEGKITATSGTIGGCSITDGVLKIKEANISGTLSADKISGGTIDATTINVKNLKDGSTKKIMRDIGKDKKRYGKAS